MLKGCCVCLPDDYAVTAAFLFAGRPKKVQLFKLLSSKLDCLFFVTSTTQTLFVSSGFFVAQCPWKKPIN